MTSQWQWLNDYDWQDYNQKTSDILENAFLEGKQKVNVDKERFVEFCDLSTLKQNFHSFPSGHKTLAGIQRRIDNPNKKKNDAGVDVDSIEETIKTRKGKITKKPNNASLCVCDDINFDNETRDIIKQFINDEIPIVSTDFINNNLGKQQLKEDDLELLNEILRIKVNNTTEKTNEETNVQDETKRFKSSDDLFEAKRKVNIVISYSKEMEVKEVTSDHIKLLNNDVEQIIPKEANNINDTESFMPQIQEKMKLTLKSGEFIGDGNDITININ
ncbi:WWE domain-containing protein [Entamoeba marina]